MQKMKRVLPLHALIWSQTISCPKITKKDQEYQLSLLLLSKEGHWSGNKGRGDLYLLLVIGAYLEHHRNKKLSTMTLHVSLIVYRNISTSTKGERNLIDISFLFGHPLGSLLKKKNLLCRSPYIIIPNCLSIAMFGFKTLMSLCTVF